MRRERGDEVATRYIETRFLVAAARGDTVYYDRGSYYGFVHDRVANDCEYLHDM